MFPPSPESPAAPYTAQKNATMGTPRVGMLVSNSDTNEDDDVSVLTFHTLGTKETGSFSLDSSHRYSEERKEIQKSLSHISEESQNSGELYTDTNEKNDRDDDEDDESLSLAETVLDSTNKLLCDIGSSSYYSGLSSKLKERDSDYAQEMFSPPPKPHSSPVKLPFNGVLQERKKTFSASFESRSNTKSTSESLFPENYAMKDKELSKCSKNNRERNSFMEPEPRLVDHYESSYLDEPNENSNKSNFQKESKHMKESGTKSDKLRKMQEETKQLHLLLREKQLESKLAMSELDASIQRASDLLS